MVKSVAARWVKSVSVTKNPGLEMPDDVPDAVAFTPGSCESDPSLDTSNFSSSEISPSDFSRAPGLAIIHNRYEKISFTFEIPCLCTRQIFEDANEIVAVQKHPLYLMLSIYQISETTILKEKRLEYILTSTTTIATFATTPHAPQGSFET